MQIFDDLKASMSANTFSFQTYETQTDLPEVWAEVYLLVYAQVGSAGCIYDVPIVANGCFVVDKPCNINTHNMPKECFCLLFQFSFIICQNN